MSVNSCQSREGNGKSIRNNSGNLLTIIILTVGVLISFGLAVVSLGLSMRTSTKDGFAAEAAALAGATEISRAVVNDEYFGYISLVDAPPVESHLCALDGQPLPVTGINSIIATAREGLIIADKLGNDYMIKLARFEAQQARRAAASLEEEIQFGLTPFGNNCLRDARGNLLHPYENAKRAFLSNVAPVADEVEQRAILEKMQFKVSLGWLADAGSTGIIIPGDQYCPPGKRVQNNYKANVCLPYAGENFYFAAIGRQPSLIIGQFKQPDGEHLSTIVKVEATTPVSLNQFKSNLEVASLAQPGALPGVTPSGSLVIDLGYSRPAGIDSLRALLAGASFGSSAEIRTASGGDVPGPGAVLRGGTVRTGEGRLATGDLLGMALFDWIRTARGRVQIESLMEALDASLTDKDESNRFCRFDIGADGRVHVARSKFSPFPEPRARENQIYCYAPMALAKSLGGISIFDHVHTLGDIKGGRHGGQVAEGESVNWIELPPYAGSPEHAATLGRSSHTLGVEACGTESFVSDRGIRSQAAYFKKSNGEELKQQPRLTYLSGGLAVLIKITAGLQN